MGFNIADPFGIIDFAKDQYGANRDYGHTREIMDSQNQFAEAMSNTSYQRAVTDMEAAGLNPMLAYSQGGAHSPGGQQAPVFNRGNSSAGSIHSAAQVQQLRAETELAKAKTENVRVETQERKFNVEHLLPEQWSTARAEASLRNMANEIATRTLVPEVAARIAEAQLREQGVPIELAKRAVELLLRQLDVPGAKFKARGYGMASEGLDGVKKFAEYAADKAAVVTNSAADALRRGYRGYERYESDVRFRRKYGR